MPQEIEKNIKPRTAFKQFLNYLHSEVLDFEKIEEDGMFDTYVKAMQFVGEIAGNSSYSPLYKIDGEILMVLKQNPAVSIKDASARFDTTYRSMAPKMTKLINLGFVSSFKENKETYYKITPYGSIILTELVLDPESVLYQ